MATPGLPTSASGDGAPATRLDLARLLVNRPVAPNPNITTECQHPNTVHHGCMYCCDRCNYDRHTCFGCGEPVPHGQYTCPECEEEFSEDD